MIISLKYFEALEQPGGQNSNTNNNLGISGHLGTLTNQLDQNTIAWVQSLLDNWQPHQAADALQKAIEIRFPQQADADLTAEINYTFRQ